MRIILFTILVITSCNIAGQVKVENVSFEQKGNNIVVKYDIAGQGCYDIQLFYTCDNGLSWTGPVKSISGDVTNIQTGKGKIITWNVLKDQEWLISDNINFKVLAAITKKGTFVDQRDGQTYKWVRIGNQVWMAENLRATKYCNGKTIINITDKRLWNNLDIDNKARCWYDNNSSNGQEFGVLYTWEAATNGQSSYNNPSNVQGVCPEGWHLPSNAEWEELALFISKDKNMGAREEFDWTEIGTYLKSATGWKGLVDKGKDEYGFAGLPGGWRNFNGDFLSIGSGSDWWCASEYDSYDAWVYFLWSFSTDLNIFYFSKRRGYSVRCVKD